ncbi:protein ABHD15 [Brachyhypopomus gauderio]|uniref:protein ABHD15 n=1 Tax=Brachyhypopomus gauderio TaxID=698409 RepID=UPI0040431455
MWDIFFCLLPSLVLVLAKLLSRSSIYFIVKAGAWKLAWNIWWMICWTLDLPLTALQDTGGDQDSEVKLICKPTALADYIKQHCATLAHAPLTKWPMADPHMQIFYNLLWPAEDDTQDMDFTRDHLLLEDGGIIALDWAVGLKDQKAHTRRDHPSGGTGCHSATSPILILIPNALGKVTHHLLSLCRLALQQGFHPVVFHRRGHGGCPLTTPRYQQFGDPSDLTQAVTYLRNCSPSSALLAVSEGSGSGLLLSYLGECGSSSHLLAAACISPVFHGRLWFESPLPWLYHNLALFYCKLKLSRYATALSPVMDVGKIFGCRSLQDMEQIMFCSVRQQDNTETSSPDKAEEPRPGSPTRLDWVAYWEQNEPLRETDEVAVPVLCFYSCDDPLLPPASTLPMALFQNSPYFLLAMTTQGSHCGFKQAEAKGVGSWSHEAVLEYFWVVADFFKVEQRKRDVERFDAWGPLQGLRQRTGATLSRRRRAVTLRRERTIPGPRRQLSAYSSSSTFEEDPNTFIRNRSYTR